MDYSKWLAAIDAVESWQNSTLMSKSEFEEALRQLLGSNSPISNIRFVLKSGDDTLVSVSTDDSVEYTDSGRFERASHVLTCEFNRTNPASSYDAVVGASLPNILRRLFDSFWKYEVRDDKTGLPTTNHPDVRDLADAFISRLISQNKYVGCAFMDGDGFGEINKRISHHAGDEIIRRAGKLFRSIAHIYDCQIIRDGGDEFTILSGVDEKQEFVTLIWDIYCELRKAKWSLPADFAFAFSAGMAFGSPQNRECGYNKMRGDAESALMSATPGKREKQRNTISLRDTCDAPVSYVEHCLLFSQMCIGSRYPFRNAWMNLIAQELCRTLTCEEDASVCLTRLVRDLRLESTSDIRQYSVASSELSGNKSISLVDVAISVFHGMSLYSVGGKDNRFSAKVHLRKHEESVQIVWGDLAVNVPKEFAIKYEGEVAVGIIPKFTKPWDVSDLERALSVGILIHIGEAPAELLALPFFEHIFVDDRPTKGGELPDFVEHSISRLLDILATNPNIQRVYCWGKEKFAQRTIDVLRRIGSGEVREREIAKMVGLAESQVVDLCARLKRKVVFVHNEEEVVHDYLSATRDLVELLPLKKREAVSGPQLVRALSEKGYSLGVEEGIRARSVAEAFPLALEILRDPNRVEIVNDRYGKKFHELVDFKIVISHPSSTGGLDYANIAGDDLNGYYRRAFGPDGTSLFGDKLASQLVPFLGELGRSVTGTPTYNTRRAILVVPNKIENDIADPLGLISIRASVALVDGQYALRFGYYWRTVEGLIGLPYSLYASVKHALLLCGKLREATRMDIVTNRLVYVASSLHISSEPSALEIAKRIVDSASR